VNLFKADKTIKNEMGAIIMPFELPHSHDSFSLAEVTVNKLGHGLTKSTKSDRLIVVLRGNGVVIVDGKSSPLLPHSIHFIPKDTYYDYKSRESTGLRVLVIDVPKFDRKYERSY